MLSQYKRILGGKDVVIAVVLVVDELARLFLRTRHAI
jgi:hypothetical protein